jgi:hypothetical protein
MIPAPDVVLLVEPDDERRSLFGGWLEDAGFDVLTCPGPTAPDYACMGGRSGRCPLVDPAALVVVDLSLSSGVVGHQGVGADVLAYYLLAELPIVTLGRGDDLRADGVQDQVVALPRSPERPALLAAIRALMPS